MKRWRLITMGALAFALGAAISRAKLWVQCRQPSSEGCVWGKAYFPLTLPVETVAFGGLLLAVFALVRVALRRRSSDQPATRA